MTYQKIKQLIVTFLIIHTTTLWPSIIKNTPLATSKGFVLVENIPCGSELIGYSDNKQCVTVTVTDIFTAITDTIVTIATETGPVNALPDQIFYDPVLRQWIQAKYLTKKSFLLDINLNPCACFNVTTQHVPPTTVYHLSTTAPHNFFAHDEALLTHNFLPCVVICATWLFGLSSIEFAGLSATAAVAGFKIGIDLLKKKKKNAAPTVNISFSHGTCGGYNPDPNDDDEDSIVKRKYNTVTKSEFFKKVSNDYEHWRDGIYKRKPRAKGIENAEYLEWDYCHNDVEAYSSNKNHIGSIDSNTLKLYKNAITRRKLPKK